MFDVIIIGGGASGLVASIYSCRRNLKTLVLTKDLGGQASSIPHIENYPGFEQTTGFELMQKFESQASKFGADIRYEEAKEIKEKGKTFVVKTEKYEYEGKTLVLAFGKTPISLNASGEREFKSKGVSYCSICDGPLFRNKTVAVAGGGNSALNTVLYLSEITKKVYVIHRGSEFRAFADVIENVKKLKNVEFVFNSVVSECRGDNFLRSIIVEDVNTKEKREIQLDGVFVELGSEVKVDLVKDFVKLNENNHIMINENCETYKPNSNDIKEGVFAAGDVTHLPFKQVVISAGEGAKAALQADNYIRGVKPAFTADWGLRSKKE